MFVTIEKMSSGWPCGSYLGDRSVKTAACEIHVATARLQLVFGLVSNLALKRRPYAFKDF